MSRGYARFIGPRPRWEFNHGVQWTRHALDRFDERTPAEACAPETAWERGETIDRPDVLQCGGQTPDRARVYREPDWGVAMLVAAHSDMDRIVTVYDLASIWDGREREYLYSFGPHGGAGDD